MARRAAVDEGRGRSASGPTVRVPVEHPRIESHGIPVLRMLTDRGTEYCGRIDQHPYQLFLALNDIEHTKTKVRSPQTNGICERFHQTILNDFLRERPRSPGALYYDSAVTHMRCRYTYRELRDEVARFAGVLREQGIGKGDRVIVA